ncbi:MAG TPA: hypothetical protein VG713_05220 [Pirellulales bacterium]|nr:hypothetical protein [Pirellulales bacterium]
MSTDAADGNANLRRAAYVLLVAIGVGSTVGRILSVNSVDKVALEKYLRDVQHRPDWQQQRPFLSGNDRSRWATVRSLVEHGTYEIDAIVSQPGWDTIDMVKHDGNGNSATGPDDGHLYSSKPPLLATLIAGPYWIIVKLTGWTLGDRPYVVGRILLVLVNVLPLMLYFHSIARMIERYGTTDWGRIFVMASAVFCTFLTTFVVVLTNHLPAAVCAAIALDAALSILVERRQEGRLVFTACLCAALAAAFELPALSFCGALMVALVWLAPRQTILFGLPAAALVAAAFFGTNYAAHHTLAPPYSQFDKPGGWYDYQYRRGSRAIDSYWRDRAKRSPVDQGEPDTATYALHSLVGHHGIFSLTPIWLLSAVGLLRMVWQRGPMRFVGLGLLSVSIVCLAFYILRPLDQRNYGGMTSGFRWAFWMAPLWLVGMLPAVDAMSSRRLLRGIGALLLAVSALSVSYPTWNPWTHPWVTEYMLWLDATKLGTR